MKVTIDARFGNKVESELAEQEQKETIQKTAKKEGHTQPKKAWIFIRYSVPIADEMRERLSKEAQSIAKEHGYDIKGETVFIGSLPQAIDELKRQMKMNPPMYGADAIVLPVEDKIMRVYDQAKELYDEMKAKEIVLLLKDCWEEVFDPTTLTGLYRKKAYERSKRLAEFLEEPLEEPQEELDEQAKPTMGGIL